jgi:TolB-like protein/class 3 adenylate cyclase/tetratricopeptide (TPR) repeat protein
MTEPREQRRLAAIMFTDMVGYSALSQGDEEVALQLLDEHRRIVRAILPQFRGTEIKTIGDAFLVEFDSALDAVRCAVQIQRTLAKRNHDVPPARHIELRIGIHIGDVVHRENDVYGDGVNIASRIQPLAPAGGICLSHDVERQIGSTFELPLAKLASTGLKNIELPVELRTVVLPWEKQRRTATPLPSGNKRRIAVISAVVALALIGGAAVWFVRQNSRVAAGVKSVAVLPFVNISSDKENEYLSDGITEDLCTALTQLKGLQVAARTSSFAFKGKTDNIRKIGDELHVGTVLEGSVSKGGNKLRITAQLVKVSDGYHLWAANYDREMTDILDIRSDISRQVVDALKVQLGVSETERLARPPTALSQAYDVYLLGRYEFNKFTEAGFNKAIEHFRHALKVDPQFALASAGLADAFNLLGYWNFLPPAVAFPAAKEAAERALQIDPNLAEARSALGFVNYEYEWRFADAERELAAAVEAKPNSADARLWYCEFLTFNSRFAEARRQLDRAGQSDPLSSRFLVDLATWYWFQRQYDPAIAQLQKAIDIDPNNALTQHFIAYVLLKTGRTAEAVGHILRALELAGAFNHEQLADLQHAFETGGATAFFRKQAQYAQKLNERGKYRSPLLIGLAYTAAGDREEALGWLEKAVNERAPWLPELKLEPTYDPLRSDPRFLALLKRVGLE